jgi:hypothetical protein
VFQALTSFAYVTTKTNDKVFNDAQPTNKELGFMLVYYVNDGCTSREPFSNSVAIEPKNGDKTGVINMLAL